MFWNSDRTPTYGYHLTPVEFHGDEAIIKMDDGWNGYVTNLPSDDILVKMSAAELAEHAGFETDKFQDVIDYSIRRWRVNPAGSLINIIKDIDQGSAGQPMFSDIQSQSQVIGAAILGKILVERNMTGVWGGAFKDQLGRKDRWKITQDYCAMTALGDEAVKVNALGRAFRIFEEKNRAMVREGLVKLPKKLYRGIRNRDLKIDTSVIDPELGRYERAVHVHQIRRELMLNNELADFSHSEILSFSANRSIAEYFAHQEGYVLEVDPSEVSVVSGWCLDDALSGKDQVTGKEEREWIMRVGNYTLNPENIINRDDDIAWVSRDVSGIEMINTNSVRGLYKLNGIRMECNSYWNEKGTKADLYFRNHDSEFGSSFKRGEFKRNYGFDPLPSAKDRVEDIEFYTYDRYSSRNSDKLIPEIDLDMDFGKSHSL